MALSPSATAATNTHRADQASLRAAFTVAFFSAWRGLLDPRRLDATTPGWLVVAEALVHRHHEASAQLAADYYRDHRRGELDALDVDARQLPRSVFRSAIGHRPDPGALRTSLMVCGPAAIRHATARGRRPEHAAAVAAVRCEASASRHVLTGGRTTTRRLVKADRVALGWARVTDANPCWFCAMLASRGPVYKTKHAATFLDEDLSRFHDGCQCTAEPTYSREAAWPGDGRRWEQLWKDTTENLSGDAARAVFRAAVEAETGRTPEARRDERRAARAAMRAERLATVGQEPLPEPTAEASAPEMGTAETPPPFPDWSTLSDDELYDQFARLSADPSTSHDVLAGLAAEMERRDENGDPDDAEKGATSAPTPAETLAATDLTALSDDEIFSLWRDHADDPDAVAILAAEMDRRDDAAPVPTAVEETPAPVEEWPTGTAEDWAHLDAELSPEQQRVESLVSQGWEYRDAYAHVHDLNADDLDRADRAAQVDAERRNGETRDDALRRMYDELVYLQYLAAEDAVRGHMLSPAGRAAGIEPLSLFSGPASRARKYASEDLLRWWAEEGNARQTFTEYKAAVLGRDSDREAATRTRLGSNGRDFI